jgi:SAM-dependent methyltransferase
VSTSDFTTVTETPGLGITAEALAMAHTRYVFAARHAAGKNVLEIACGAGQGLGCIRRPARRVVGGDFTASLLETASSRYRRQIPLVRFDAQSLPFLADSFDVVLILEAIYYLPNADEAVRECSRVLRDDGILMICTINPEWTEFNPSPFSRRYYTAAELDRLLRDRGFTPTLFGGFVQAADSLRSRVIGWIKRQAVSMHLVPRTMRGKRLLKRIFLGPLVASPDEIVEGTARYDEPAVLQSGSAGQYKVLYAIARK